MVKKKSFSEQKSEGEKFSQTLSEWINILSGGAAVSTKKEEKEDWVAPFQQSRHASAQLLLPFVVYTTTTCMMCLYIHPRCCSFTCLCALKQGTIRLDWLSNLNSVCFFAVVCVYYTHKTRKFVPPSGDTPCSFGKTGRQETHSVARGRRRSRLSIFRHGSRRAVISWRHSFLAKKELFFCFFPSSHFYRVPFKCDKQTVRSLPPTRFLDLARDSC